jgi:hypothetical protein
VAPLKTRMRGGIPYTSRKGRGQSKNDVRVSSLAHRSQTAANLYIYKGQVTINRLPDDALLEIFNRYRENQLYYFTWWWETLAHVCRRWRRIVFESPRHLHLLLACNGNTPTTTSLHTWPASLPIAVTCFPWHVWAKKGVENILAALRCRDRLSEVTLDGLNDSALERFAAVMQEPLPALTYLRLSSPGQTALALPESFLGGSAPHLRSFALVRIPFPTFPSFALSARHLHSLRLWDIPDAGYISPETMATCLAELPSLEALSIGFLLSRPRLFQASPPPATRIRPPSLTYFAFRGHGGYLEDLKARVDIPSINRLELLDIRERIILPDWYTSTI